jgi:hypothetical protein
MNIRNLSLKFNILGTLSSFYKNIFYKNIKARFWPKFKNILAKILAILAKI